MDSWTAESEAAFDGYVEALVEVIGHADRAEPLKDYCLGLLLPVERKSVEPLAAVTAPSRVSAKHQSLLHFVGQAPWSDEALLARVRDRVLPRIERHGCQPALKRDPLSAPKRDPLPMVGGNAPDAPELLRWRRRVRRVSGRRGSGQARFLKRQLSLPVSTMSQWWVSRSRSAVVILASPKTLGHSPKARLVVTITEVRS